jgi:KDO2-lipid IV(A) lauroyltransferase
MRYRCGSCRVSIDLHRAPPWRFDTPEARRALFRWWLRDPLHGLQDWLPHQAFRLLPTSVTSAVGARLGARQVAGRPGPSATARETLRLLRPDIGEAEAERLVRAHWIHLGRTFAEFSVLHRLWREGRIEVAGREHLDAAIASGRPLVVAGIHVGSWEALHVGLGALGIRFSGIYQRLPNRFRMRIADAARLRSQRINGPGVPLAPTLGAVFEAHRLLESREAALLTYVDEFVGGRVHAPLLGRPLRVEGNIARAVRLASQTGAAVLPCYALRLGEEARFRLTFLPEVPVGTPDRGRTGIKADIAALDAAIEGVVRAHPEQWFMLHAFRPDR